MKKENKMGTEPIAKLVITMSLPIMLSMLVQAMYNIVDSIFVSNFDTNALSAVSAAFSAQNLMIGIATGTGVGVNALLSRAIGAKNHKLAQKYAVNGVFFSFVGYSIPLLFGLFASKLYMQCVVDANDPNATAIIEYGRQYLTVVCCWSFGLYGEIIFERLMQSTGRTLLTMFTQGLGAIVNIVLDPIFIFKKGEGIFGMGVFGMGAEGAAIATVIGQCAGFVLGIILNHHYNKEIKLSFRGFRPDFKIAKSIYAIGVPSIIMVAIGSVMFYLMLFIIKLFTASPTPIQTVFGVYFKLNSFVFMPIFGLNNGVIPIIAFNYGARRRKRMMQAVKCSAVFASALMLIGFIIFMAFPGQLLSIFSVTPDMIQIGTFALRIISISFIFAGISIVLGSVFQALGHGTLSMIVSIVRQLVVLLPAALVLCLIGRSVGNDNLLWFSYPVAETASLLVSLFLFRRIYKNQISLIPENGDAPEDISEISEISPELSADMLPSG